MKADGTEATGVDIRRLESAEQVHSCAEYMAASQPWITLRRTYEEGVGILTDAANEVYVALVGGELAGFTILQMQGAFVGYIKTLGVLPQWRNRGIGSQLIAFAEERIFRETPNVFICASSFNLGAQRLYRRLGYEIVGELKDYIVAGHGEVLFRKTIGPLRDFNKT